MKTLSKYSALLIASGAFLTLGLTSCDGDDDGGAVIPTSGNSNVGAAPSILGGTLRMTFVSGDPLAFQGDVTYTFVNQNTILGEGSIDLQAQQWTYTVSGNTGRIDIINQNQTTNTITLTFQTPTTGTYVNTAGNLRVVDPQFPVNEVTVRGNFVLTQ